MKVVGVFAVADPGLSPSTEAHRDKDSRLADVGRPSGNDPLDRKAGYVDPLWEFTIACCRRVWNELIAWADDPDAERRAQAKLLDNWSPTHLGRSVWIRARTFDSWPFIQSETETFLATRSSFDAWAIFPLIGNVQSTAAPADRARYEATDTGMRDRIYE